MQLRNPVAWACLLGGFLGGPRLLGQTEPVGGTEVLPPVIVDLVRIDVVVTEKGGQPTTGLTRDDFVVLEDGEPQTIVQFQAYQGLAPGSVLTPALAGETPREAPAEPPAKEAPPLPPARRVVLLVDDLHMEFSSLGRVKKALSRFLEEDLWPEDRVAVLTTSGTDDLPRAFTSDRAALERGISRLSLRDHRVGWSGIPYISPYQAELIESGDEDALEAAIQEVLIREVCQDRYCAESLSRNKARGIYLEAVQSARLTLETVEGLVRGLARLSGRKVVFLVSDGFLTGLTAGSGAAFDLRRIADAGTRSGVVVYSLDTRGAVASTPIASASSSRPVVPSQVGLIESMRWRGEQAERDALHALAADTGGFLVDSSNDLRGGLRRMLKDTETYYVLAYEPTNPIRDGKFRHIEVSLPDHRDLDVRARSGYFATDDRLAAAAQRAREAEARRAQRRETLLKTALDAPMPLTDIPVWLSADFVSLETGVAQVVVSGHVEAPPPATQAEGPPAVTVDTLAVLYDQNGEVTGNLGWDETSIQPAPAGQEEASGVGFDYRRTTVLPPGRYQVRLVASENATGMLGSAWTWVDIPDLSASRLVLSSIFLLRAEDAAEAAEASLSNVALQSAQADRRFRRDESLYLQFYAYQPRLDGAGAASLVSQVEVLRDGLLLAQGAPEPIGSAGAPGAVSPHTTRIDLRPFEPGDYSLRLTVNDKDAREMAMRFVEFTVE
jgi:VWFA-related protein